MNPVLNYILDSVVGDERPYLRLSIYGIEVLGLLDSDASRTIMNGRCWSLLRNLGVTLNSTRKVTCTVANRQVCSSIGSCTIPMMIKGEVVVMEVLIIMELPQMMLLGADFWKILGIVTNLRNNEWFFSSKPIEIAGIDTNLDEDQSRRLQEMVDKNMKLMVSTLGCTSVIEHEIIVDGPPAKQR